MARKRMIDPNMWQSEDFSHLTPLAKIVFVGMISNADDEGRGRAKPVYLKSILFPYDDALRAADIEKSLQEISAYLSVTLYDHDGNKYYQLDNWHKWQKIDRPQKSQISPPNNTVGDDSSNDRRTLDDESLLIEENTKEEEKTEENVKRAGAHERKPFSPPTLEEVCEYCKQRKNNVDPDRFWDYFNESGWIDSQGNPVRNWKQKVITWEPIHSAQSRNQRSLVEKDYESGDDFFSEDIT